MFWFQGGGGGWGRGWVFFPKVFFFFKNEIFIQKFFFFLFQQAFLPLYTRVKIVLPLTLLFHTYNILMSSLLFSPTVDSRDPWVRPVHVAHRIQLLGNGRHYYATRHQHLGALLRLLREPLLQRVSVSVNIRRATLKKSLFPVQRVVKIVASRDVAKYFLSWVSFLGRK